MSFWEHVKFMSHRHYAESERQDYVSKKYGADLCDSCCILISTITATRMAMDRSSLFCKQQKTLYELTHSKCPVCQLFGSLRMEVVHTLTLRPTAMTAIWTNSVQVKTQSIYTLNPDSEDYDPLKSGHLLVFQEAYAKGRFRGIGTFGVIHPMFANNDIKPRHVESLAIDGNVLREWLGFCEANHHDTCRPTTSKTVAGFKVLDCKTRTVIRPGVGCRYVALSYTWGLGMSEKSDGSFPRTIEDSILITLELGFRYLWIDKYCIDQTDVNEKHNQIQQMDVIYLTIVAAAGNNSDYGLPGVSTRARKEQKRLALDGVELLQIYSDSEELRLSSWASRAWTLQEGYLAKRRLIFTNREVSFLCEHMHCQESVEQKLHHRTRDTGDSWDGLDGAHLFGVIPNRNWESFRTDRILAEYTRRNLSFDTDALNACLGILKATEISHWFGMPVELDSYEGEQKYTLNLQWRGSARAHERPGFPSWSWASISGAKRFPEYHSQYARDCTISVQKPNGEWLTFDEWMESGGDNAVLKESHCLRIYSYVWRPKFEVHKKTSEIRATNVGRVDMDLMMKDYTDFLSDAVAVLLQFSRHEPPWTSAIALILKPSGDGDRYRRVGITDWDSRMQFTRSDFEAVGMEKRTVFVE